MLQSATKIIHKGFDLLFPQHCFYCDRVVNQDIAICECCFAQLPWNGKACLGCARQLVPTASIDICGECQQHPLPIDRSYALFRYEMPIAKQLMSFKFSRQLIFAKTFGYLMANEIRASWYVDDQLPELIIAAPLHKRNLRQRGFNQALELAKVISKQLGIPLDMNCCIKHQETLPQHEMTARLRKSNVANAFTMVNLPAVKHVAIVDDIFTTGNTVAAISRALIEAGVERVDVWCCARTQR